MFQKCKNQKKAFEQCTFTHKWMWNECVGMCKNGKRVVGLEREREIKKQRDGKYLMTHDNRNIIDGICYNFSAILSNELSWSININGASPMTLIDPYMLSMVSPCTWYSHSIIIYPKHRQRHSYRIDAQPFANVIDFIII